MNDIGGNYIYWHAYQTLQTKWSYKIHEIIQFGLDHGGVKYVGSSTYNKFHHWKIIILLDVKWNKQKYDK